MKTDDNKRHDDEVGAELRAAYRRIATEKAPQHLNDAVLAAATKAPAATGRGLWRWRRPLAWITMIGLSFAIVLEFNQTGTDLVPEAGQTLPPGAPTRDEARGPADRSEDPTAVRSTPLPQAARTASGDATAVDRPDASDGDMLEDSVATETEAAKRSRDEELEVMSSPMGAELRERDEEIEEIIAAPGESEPATSSADRALGLTASGAAERQRAGTGQTGDVYLDQAGRDVPACDAEARADPEQWRACIVGLLEADRAGDAMVELGRFRREFPDEPLPALSN